MNQAPGSAPFMPVCSGDTSRAHRLDVQRGFFGRLAIQAQNRLESWVARVSRLRDAPVYDSADFAWVPEVERDWHGIRAELDAVMRERERLPNFQEILSEVQTINRDDHWKTYWLIGSGIDCSGNAQRCPQTMAALQRIPGVLNAFFSILAPGKHVPPHRGAYNGILRYHLGLIVPEPRERAGIRIADRICGWEEGRSLIFDDSFNHEAWNFTGGWRVVLFVDFARPLRQPWHALNRALLAAGALLPMMRRAASRHRDWHKRFYREPAG
jgi:aspartyl/asparaginyl beta-hydroxylase (cupin superfamily)